MNHTDRESRTAIGLFLGVVLSAVIVTGALLSSGSRPRDDNKAPLIERADNAARSWTKDVVKDAADEWIDEKTGQIKDLWRRKREKDEGNGPK